jgi:hypothetical protein
VLLNQSSPFCSAAKVKKLQADEFISLPSHGALKDVASLAFEQIEPVGYADECHCVGASSILGKILYGAGFTL